MVDATKVEEVAVKTAKINLSDTVLKVFLAVAIISLGTIWLANAVNPSTTIGTGISTATVTTTGNVSIGGILGLPVPQPSLPMWILLVIKL